MTDSRPPLVCNCRILLVNLAGERITPRSRRWDCPSCGLDKANRIRDFVVAQGADRMWTLTFPQPEYLQDGQAPIRHTLCDPATHVYTYADGRRLWRMLESCPHCCRYSARALAVWRKRLRRQWPDAQILWVREVKPQSGAFDINVVISGVPPLSRKNVGGRKVKAWWYQETGGHMDLGEIRRKGRSPGGVGRYIGKYLTKHAGRPLARGFRRWSRTAGFAAGLTMETWISEKLEPPEPIRWGFLGWVDPAGEVMAHGLRWWLPPAANS